MLSTRSSNTLQDAAPRKDSVGLTKALDNIKSLSKNIARSTDLLFLKSFLGSNSCIEQKQFNMIEYELPVTHDSMKLIEQAKTICEQRIYLDEAKELYSLISSKWLQAVLEIHDEVAAQIQNSIEAVEYIDGVSSIEELEEDDEDKSTDSTIDNTVSKVESEDVQIDTFRVIGIRRQPGQCLGLTVCKESNKLIVARVLMDSIIDRQGLVQPGDIILQANGKDVQDPEKLKEVMQQGGEFIIFKIQPAERSQTNSTIGFKDSSKVFRVCKDSKFFVRALFNYEPENDNLLPCQDIGLSFSRGDVLEIVNCSDPNWWQARKVNCNDRTGLIPSQDLEERRKCFVQNPVFPKQISCCGASGRKEKSKYGYMVRKNLQFDKAEVMLYEPVEKMPPFSRKTLVLVGSSLLDKNSIIQRLVASNQAIFGTTLPKCTQQEETSTTKMLTEKQGNKYTDADSDEANFYTTLESVKKIINEENKLCIIDCKPEALKLLHDSTELLPLVIYLSLPEDLINNDTNYFRNFDPQICENEVVKRKYLQEDFSIRQEFYKYFDLEIVFETVEATTEKIKSSLDSLATNTQWVPRNWVY